MDAAKITLSEEEMRLVQNAEWILTKNAVLSKAVDLLSNVRDRITRLPSTATLPKEVTHISAKISQGENYLGLPYRILDFPRAFGKEDRFAIRCFFWWGKFFSITVHAKGSFQDAIVKSILAEQRELENEGYFLCIGSDEWQHHFAPDNYVPLSEIKDITTRMKKADFFKMAKTLPVSDWALAEDWFVENFEKITKLISFQGDETDL